jgi:hypothetical protein
VVTVPAERIFHEKAMFNSDNYCITGSYGLRVPVPVS